MKMLARNDRIYEDQRKETLSFNFKTNNLQPSAFREKIDLTSCFIKAMIPVLTETFSIEFNGTKRPKYTKIKEEWLKDPSAIGVLTGRWTGHIPPVTMCEQFNDLRVDTNHNKVTTYLFVDIEVDTLSATVKEIRKEIKIIKEQQFESQNYPKEPSNFDLNLS